MRKSRTQKIVKPLCIPIMVLHAYFSSPTNTVSQDMHKSGTSGYGELGTRALIIPWYIVGF